MRRLFVLALLAVPVRADDLTSTIEKHAAKLTADRANAALVVGLVQNDGERFFSFGRCEGKSADRDSVFEIGSVTKVFTGILLAEQVHAGAVRFDDPVQKHLPEGWTVPRRDNRDITLLHLATHTSGLPKQADGFLAFAIAEAKNPYARYDLAALTKGLATTKLADPIGSRQVYSNVGVGLLGHALVHASRATNYETLLRDHVLRPLELGDTGITLTESQKNRLIPGHDAKGTRKENWDFASIPGCGALRSTAGDMIKFIRANVALSGPLRDVLAVSHQPWRVVQPGKEEAGLCWVRFPVRDHAPQIWHNGQTGGYHAFVGLVPGRGGVVILFNVAEMKVDDLGFAVLKQLTEAK